MKDDYVMKVPGFPKDKTTGRAPLELPFRPPRELLEEQVSEDPSVILKTQEMLAEGKWPPAYTERPVVQSSSSTVVPIA
eukprot:5575177-Alexandrium_andersonii.AAC.1